MLKIYTNDLILPLLYIGIIFLLAETKNLPKVVKIGLSLVPVLIILLFILSYTVYYFVGGGINEAVIYHLAIGFEGINSWKDFYPLFKFTLIIIAIALLVPWITYRYIISFPYKKIPGFYLSFSLLAIIFHPFMFNVSDALLSYYSKPTTDEIILFDELNADNRYKQSTIIMPNKKNIVFLLVESLDQHYYRDNDLFPDLMPKLKSIAKQHIDFINIHQLDTTWSTVAGTTGAIQCGIPLVVREHRGDGDDKSVNRSRFLMNAYCISDYLKQHDYNAQFITADNPKFTYVENFYLLHGLSKADIYGKNRIKQLSKKMIELGSWGEGVYDKDLLVFAKQQYLELSSSQVPFALFISTLDTHRENGYLHPDCSSAEKEDELPIFASIRCTDKVINDFYNFIKSQENRDDTILIIASDHVFPSNNKYFEQLSPYQRRNTFILVDFSSSNPQVIDRNGSTLDVGVTVLDYLGSSINKLNFGRSLFSNGNKTLVEQFGHAETDKLIKRWRILFSKFWMDR